ncbi:FeS-binding protein [Pelomonas aquatica]|uniref:FeS-binding protein n=1 Tax=Pelomonas aquatica TaxID=431058 RepID=A0A9X4LFY8_9BURK|nr:FeS-binding protein [Pelomonas aquatica]
MPSPPAAAGARRPTTAASCARPWASSCRSAACWARTPSAPTRRPARARP